jgi:alpha-L-fucosidase 2
MVWMSWLAVPLWMMIVGGVGRAADETAGAPETEYVLCYNRPAGRWGVDTLPIGNGRLGGMIFGGIREERIQFNEDSLWIGDEADAGAFQAFGDVRIAFDHPEGEAYFRRLDISRAVHETGYRVGNVNYLRTSFASHPAHVLAFRLTADRVASLSGCITLSDAHEATIRAEGDQVIATGSLEGYLYKKDRGENQQGAYSVVLDYESRLQVIHSGGTIQVAANGEISFKNCDSLLLLLAAGTDFVREREQGWKGEPPRERLRAILEAASRKTFEKLLAEHVADYQSLFNRVSIDLGESNESVRRLTTDQRLLQYRGPGFQAKSGNIYDGFKTPEGPGGHDPALEALLFQYARYLMISSSRPGSNPANLQGLWNDSNNPRWRCDYHTDVNVQMNYWFTGPANLTDCFEPLAEWLHAIIPVRRDATREHFGTRGWATRSENGLFGGASYHWVPGDAAWVAQNIWDHYAFSQSRTYLETRAYPIIKDLCEFWEDSLEEDADGNLVSPPSVSPEHGPQAKGNSYEQQLVYDLFTNAIEASMILDVDADFRGKLEQMRSRLAGPRIGRWGQLQEWAEDRDDPKEQHRHLSHLIAVYPGRQISPLSTPDLAEAAKVSMNARGDESTGWSRPWKVCIWARLLDGDRAYRILNGMARTQFTPNLLATHPPFQIDGNFGYAAGVCEMLLQSHLGCIHLLPALPEAWPTGSVTGLRARSGFTVDMAWTNGVLTRAVIRSEAGAPCRVKYGNKLIELMLKAGESRTLTALDFE